MSQKKIIWGAIVFSTFIYALLLFMLSREWPKPATTYNQAVNSPMVLALFGAALVVFLMGQTLPRAMSSKAAAWIPSLALSEASAIFGLLAAFLTRDWRLFIAPWILALIGFVTQWPSTEDPGSASPPSHRPP